MPDPRPNPLPEVAAVMAVTALGAVVRLWSADRLGLTHFDEGIYALAGLWPYSPRGLAGIDPTLISYAPPGFPILVGLAYLLVEGPADGAAIAVAEVCGILTIPVVGWLGRRTFGPGAGAGSAAFAALSGPHVAFSRMALTDVPFLFTWLIALGLGARLLERPRLGRALAFGMAVGLAQNFKYNGWLAGAIVAATATVGLLRRGRDRVEAARAIAYGLVAAVVALAVYAPWFLFIEQHGGYRALLRHHRQYTGGLSTWLPYWSRQLDQAVALSGLLAWGMSWGVAAWGLAWLAAAIAARGCPEARTRSRGTGMRARLGLVIGLLASTVLPTLPWWVGCAWVPWLLRDHRPAVRLLSVWWSVMSIFTPFYHPYARLWLPLHAAGWLMLGGVIFTLRDPTLAQQPPGANRRHLGWVGWSSAVGLACCLVTAARQDPIPRPQSGLLDPSDELRRTLSSRIVADWKTQEAVRLLTLARPPVTFYLAGRVPIRPQAGLKELVRESRSRDSILIDVALVEQGGDGRELRRLQESWSHGRGHDVRALDIRMSLPTLLDEDHGAALRVEDLGGRRKEPPFRTNRYLLFHMTAAPGPPP